MEEDFFMELPEVNFFTEKVPNGNEQLNGFLGEEERGNVSEK